MSNIYSGKVLKGPLRVRKNPEIKQGNIVNIINKNRDLIIYEIRENWVRHDQGGWSLIKNDNNTFIEVYKKEAVSLSKPYTTSDPVTQFRLSFDTCKMDDEKGLICKYDDVYPSIKFTEDDVDKRDPVYKDRPQEEDRFKSYISNLEKAIANQIGSEDNDSKYLNGSRFALTFEGKKIIVTKHNDKWTTYITNSAMSSILNLKHDPKGTTYVNDSTTMVTDPDKEFNIDSAEMNDIYSSILSDDDIKSLQCGTISIKDFINEAPKIFGMPYQFDEITDPRPSNSVYGKKFLEKMVAQMPLLYLTPGSPKFLDGNNDDDRDNILTAVADFMTGNPAEALSTLEEIFSSNDFKDTKYYTFEFNGSEYYEYVNGACYLLYKFLKLDDFAAKYQVQGEIIDASYRWQEYMTDAMSYLGSGSCIGFYMDSDTQTSESFSNASGESSLASTINNAANTVNEFQFLLGTTQKDKGLLAETIEGLRSGFESFLGDWGPKLSKPFSSRLEDAFEAVTSGGKMIFPKIWQDSSFSRSYSCSFKLSTPDADDFSWYMNIGVPYMHLVCMTAPKQSTTNSFTGPFLVRAYSKGFMDVDMGLISSLSVTKGDKCKWNLNGLPTEVSVSIDIEDLYTVMSITKAGDYSSSDFLKNTAMMNYIANMCGVNVSKPDYFRAIDMMGAFKIGSMSPLNIYKDVKDLFFNIGQGVDNILDSIYRS